MLLFFIGGAFIPLQAMPLKVFRKEVTEKTTTTERAEEQGRRITDSDDDLSNEEARGSVLMANEEDSVVTKEPLSVSPEDLLNNNRLEFLINSSLQLCKAFKEQLDANELEHMPYLKKFFNEGLSSDEEYGLLRTEMAMQVSNLDAAVFLRLLLAKTKAPEIFFTEKLTIPITGETRSNDLLSGKQVLQVPLPLNDGRPIRIHKILHDALNIKRTEPWNSKNPSSPIVSVEGSLVLRDPIPQTFVVCLDRFADQGTKNQKLISGLGESVILTDQNGHWISYEPIAIICHEGSPSLENGRYICFRREQGSYYCYSGTTVKGPYTLNGTLTQKNAYLIAYQRSLTTRAQEEDVTTTHSDSNIIYNLSDDDESSSNSEDESADFWIQRHFAILGRQIRKKNPSDWNKMLFDLMKISTPFEKDELMTEEEFNQEIDTVLAEAEEKLFYLKEARGWLTKKIHYAICKERPLITESNNPVRELEIGRTLSPWQPTIHYPYQQLRTVDFSAESNAPYWDQQHALLSQFLDKEVNAQRRSKFEEALAACKQAKEEAHTTKKALEKLILDIGSTEEIRGYTSRRWDRLVTHSLTSVDDFLGFKFELEEIERLSEDEDVSYAFSPGFKFILPEAKKYFKEKWKGFATAREQLIRSVVSSSSLDADHYARLAVSQCETFYNQFKKTPILAKQIGELLIEPLKRELLTAPKHRAMKEQKKIKDTAYYADETHSIWI